jgi:peroxiredoxin
MRPENDTKKSHVSRNRRYWRWLFEFLLLVALVLGLHAYQTRDLARGPAPVFNAQLLDGRWINLNDYRGRTLLLHFWASWCPVCRLEQASIDNIARDQTVLTVTLDEMSASELQRWMQEQGVSYPVVQDKAGEMARQYGVRGVPTSIIIDGAGRIRFTEVGFTTETGLRLRLWWAGL